MKNNVYCVRNILSGVHSGLYLFPTDGSASVNLAVNLAPQQYSIQDKRKFITEELQLMRVGTFDIETAELRSSRPVIIPWDFRRFVETPMNIHRGTVQDIETQFALDTSEVDNA